MIYKFWLDHISQTPMVFALAMPCHNIQHLSGGVPLHDRILTIHLAPCYSSVLYKFNVLSLVA